MRIHYRCLVGVFTVLFAAVGQAQAGMIIQYADVGSDLFFSWSGSLNAAAGDGVDPPGGPTYATIAIQGDNPTFYSAPKSHPDYIFGIQYTGPNNPGYFATSAPQWGFSSHIMAGSTSTGLPFLFRLNNATSGTTSLDVWADWGPANSPIVGTMTIAGQSAASMGMVNGFTIQTNAGNIVFQAVEAAPTPEPASMALLAMGGGLLAFGRKRLGRRRQSADVAA